MRSEFARLLVAVVVLGCLVLCTSLFAQVPDNSTWSRRQRANPSGNQTDPTAFSRESCGVGHFQLLCATPYNGLLRLIDSSCGDCGITYGTARPR
jgi:hypothetical protein